MSFRIKLFLVYVCNPTRNICNPCGHTSAFKPFLPSSSFPPSLGYVAQCSTFIYTFHTWLIGLGSREDATRIRDSSHQLSSLVHPRSTKVNSNNPHNSHHPNVLTTLTTRPNYPKELRTLRTLIPRPLGSERQYVPREPCLSGTLWPGIWSAHTYTIHDTHLLIT